MVIALIDTIGHVAASKASLSRVYRADADVRDRLPGYV
jgi:hypothetical protein